MPGQPLVIAYHLIWTVYGWWLPNDPRGSGSRTIRNDILRHLGQLHLGRKAMQPAGRAVGAFYEQAADLLQHPLLTFDSGARAAIAQAFADTIACQRYTCWACAIMPDHVHILIRKHKHLAEEMIGNLKALSRKRLELLPRWSGHPVWADGGGWKVFLDHPDEVRRTIAYIRNNPRQCGLPSQSWPFVVPYDGWPLHPGHSPHSPYTRALRAAGRYP